MINLFEWLSRWYIHKKNKKLFNEILFFVYDIENINNQYVGINLLIPYLPTNELKNLFFDEISIVNYIVKYQQSKDFHKLKTIVYENEDNNYFSNQFMTSLKKLLPQNNILSNQYINLLHDYTLAIEKSMLDVFKFMDPTESKKIRKVQDDFYKNEYDKKNI